MSTEDSECSGRPKESGWTINSYYNIALLGRLKDEIAEKWPHLKKKKVMLHQNNAPCHKLVKTVAKIHEMGFKLLPYPPHSTDLAPGDYFLFFDLKGTLVGKKYSSNEEVIAETEAYFEAKDKNDIEMLEGRYNQCHFTLEGNYVE
ncbi:hypothetical protein GWI33_017145 [Rhynchophorus ferrugineus]|uniref:Histone-lysine N-methyltransferase SETMAR n=1 Tax=Rhynchophorus ferrugineus TaxID=354439 RepID=A0A834I2I3_RHYFE|nr:hypothetical protein GWI33_017145 [Rhynchophorus ferrugineus]